MQVVTDSNRNYS